MGDRQNRPRRQSGRDPLRALERRMGLWLGVTYAAIALLVAALIAYCFHALGWPPNTG
jgi:hypothetical protein